MMTTIEIQGAVGGGDEAGAGEEVQLLTNSIIFRESIGLNVKIC